MSKQRIMLQINIDVTKFSPPRNRLSHLLGNTALSFFDPRGAGVIFAIYEEAEARAKRSEGQSSPAIQGDVPSKEENDQVGRGREIVDEANILSETLVAARHENTKRSRVILSAAPHRLNGLMGSKITYVDPSNPTIMAAFWRYHKRGALLAIHS